LLAYSSPDEISKEDSKWKKVPVETQDFGAMTIGRVTILRITLNSTEQSRTWHNDTQQEEAHRMTLRRMI
jgi:hypothetical protein